MDNSNNIDLMTAFRKMSSENRSMEGRLEEYAKIIKSRDEEIEMLQTMLSEANEYRSTVDNQLRELRELQQYINDLQRQVSGTNYMVSGKPLKINDAPGAEQQLEAIKPAYSYLQSQLADLQEQLQEMNNRNIQLQQQNGRIAELESLLANAEQERDEVRRMIRPIGRKDF